MTTAPLGTSGLPAVPRAAAVAGGVAPGAPRVGAGDRLRAAAVAAAPIALVLVAQLVLFPMPPGVWLQGVVFGVLGALMAVGLGLVYRLNHIVNFAQGNLGSAPAVLAVGLIGFSGVNYAVGLMCGLLASALIALVAEVVVVRRFARSPRLMLTVATIGLSQALVVVSLLLPDLWGQQPVSSAVAHLPWHVAIRLTPVVFSADDITAVAVSLVILAALALWMRRTELGIATRAIGDRRDRAAMLGIPVNRAQTLVWMVAGALSFLSLFFKATIVGLPLDPIFGLTALVGALAALALGGFTDLPAVAIAAVVVGVLEQGVAWDHPASPTLVLAVLAGVVLVAMAIRQMVVRPGRSRAGQWVLAAEVRDVPERLRSLPEVRWAQVVGSLAVVTGLATLPLWLGPGALLDLSNLVVLAIVGCSVVVLTGWGGQVSLGQMAFAAVGAVAGAAALGQWHWDLSLALLVAAAAGGAAAWLVGLPTIRLDGVFVAVTTLAVGLAVPGYLLDRAQFSWVPSGQLGTVRIFGAVVGSQTAAFVTCLVVGILVVVAMRGLRSSRFGRVLRAQTTNERATAGFGVDVNRAKLSAFAVSGCIAGVAGCLLVVLNQGYIEAPFTASTSIAVFTATAVGGIASSLGAVVGGGLVEGSATFLPPSWQAFPSAFGVLVVLLLYPGGVAGGIFEARDWFVRRMARHHGLELDRPEPPTVESRAVAAAVEGVAAEGVAAERRGPTGGAVR